MFECQENIDLDEDKANQCEVVERTGQHCCFDATENGVGHHLWVQTLLAYIFNVI